MQFKLIYEGPLKGQSAKDEAKHVIRMQLHPQLEMLWTYGPLKHRRQFLRYEGSGKSELGIFEHRNGFTFAPLVSSRLDLVAGLHVLLMRREAPGNLFSQSGDIDNRVKVLIDALRMPSADELRRAKADAVSTPNPVFCVLQDDSLLTSVAVETETLLTPGPAHEVLALITLTVKAARLTFDNLGLSA
jgi:hypothetical protein